MIAGRTDSMDTAYCFYKWNAFPLINKYQIMYEHKLLLQIFNNYFRSYADCHSHFTRAQKNCYDASACTNIRLFAIKCSGPTLMANNLVFEGAWPLFLVDVCVCRILTGRSETDDDGGVQHVVNFTKSFHELWPKNMLVA